MGFTPLEGLVMATRSGSDRSGSAPLARRARRYAASELASTLEHRSGLLGLTGSADMRTILEAEAAGSPEAALAIEVYLHRLRAGIAAMAAAMDGLDALVFTGGVGERSAPVRARAAEGLSFLGVVWTRTRTKTLDSTRRSERPGAAVRTFAIEAREDLQIARDVRRVLGATP